jgi:hypothetical protein
MKKSKTTKEENIEKQIAEDRESFAHCVVNQIATDLR